MRRNLVTIIVWVSFCVLSLVAGGKPALAEKEVRLGVLTAISGPAAPWGIPIARSIYMGADKINDSGGFKVNGETYKWKVTNYDTKHTPAVTVNAINKAINSDKIQYASIMGDAPLLACIPQLKSNNILSLNACAGGKVVINSKNPLVFRYNGSLQAHYAVIIPYIQEKDKIKTIASINPDAIAGRSAEKTLKNQLDYMDKKKNIKIKIVASEFFKRGEKEFTPMLIKIMDKNPDLIETGMSPPTSIALMCKQARELGYKGQILLNWHPMAHQMIKIAGRHAEGAYLGTYLSKPQDDYQKDIQKRFFAKGYPKKEWGEEYFVNFALAPNLTKAIVKCQSFDAEKIAKTLENLNFRTAYGPSWFGGNKVYGIKRQLIIPVSLLQVKNGKAVHLITAPPPKGLLD